MKRVFIGMVILLTAAATLHAVPTPVARWAFDGNTNDTGTNADHGTVRGNPQYVEGRIGQAMLFDGDGDGVTIPNENHYDQTTFSVSFWVKVPAGSQTQGDVISKLILGGYLKGDQYFKGFGWSFKFLVGDYHSDSIMMYNRDPGGGRYDLVPSFYHTMNDGKWHHIVAAMTTDTAKDSSLYIDGILVAIDSEDEINWSWPATIVNDTPLTFGYNYSRPGVTDWEGALDDVQFFNTYLTQTDVTDIFNAAGGACTGLDGDIDADCRVDLNDFTLLAQDWLNDGF